MTVGDLAQKFGWISVVGTTLLLPFLLLWSRLLAFPIWLPKSKNKLFSMSTFSYERENLFWNELYISETNPSSFPKGMNGWNCHVDATIGQDGGKFYESFCGILHCLDCEKHEDYLHITPNRYYSWLPVTVFVEFCVGKRKGHAHRVRFFFPMDGPNKYNPFAWITLSFVVLSLQWFSKVAFKKFKEDNNVEVNGGENIGNEGGTDVEENVDKGGPDVEENTTAEEYVKYNPSGKLTDGVEIFPITYSHGTLHDRTASPNGEEQPLIP